ncbi:MAG: hypothetical protein IJ535_12770 [Pseudobutyrivibrio sp.]|uniref:hypothetical protein n=1 Tax=Pseudobutyrivibrio sp. TaxID=2014367 RepID=UPI0025D089E2|nr:hypothetical protein [Pseudobutyrivibrio sp.]MBQ8490645.1 hypothetical protein [Pseudobutyrivibrio sp.]
MKIKFISLLFVVVLSCSGFIACGNSQKKQAMDELGISSAEYDEISSALNGSSTKSKSKSKVETTEKTEVVEEVKKEPIKYDQKEELKTYNLSDYVFQIDDKIIDLTPGKTVEEIVDIFSGYEIEVGNEDLNLDKLITEGGMERLHISNTNQPINQYIGEFVVDNYTDGTVTLKECKLSIFYPSSYYDGSIYLAPGFSMNIDDIGNNDGMTFGSIEEYLVNNYNISTVVEKEITLDSEADWQKYIGTTAIEKDSSGLKYNLAIFLQPMVEGNTKYYTVLNMTLNIDQNTSHVGDISMGTYARDYDL